MRDLSVIIPARDEAHNLPVLLDSIRGQPDQPGEVIVVDDASTDATAEVARQFGVKVITSQPLPEGWRGKTWACQQGADAARGNRLLFADADTWFEPGGLVKLVSQHATGALSVCPYHAVRQPYEQLCAFFNLTMAAATVPHGLLGPMLLVDRASYQKVGGHQAVRGRILEHLRLAGDFRQAGIETRSRVGRGLLAFRMYPHGTASMIEGWTKGFASGAGSTPGFVMLLISAWLGGLVLPLILWPLSPLALWVYLAFAIQAGLLLRQVGRFSWLTALLYPIPMGFYLAIFARSLLRSGKTVRWKGREIRAD
jgi:4,4'-diaponeurosporenoate glycosyltransferase